MICLKTTLASSLECTGRFACSNEWLLQQALTLSTYKSLSFPPNAFKWYNSNKETYFAAEVGENHWLVWSWFCFLKWSTEAKMFLGRMASTRKCSWIPVNVTINLYMISIWWKQHIIISIEVHPTAWCSMFTPGESVFVMFL